MILSSAIYSMTGTITGPVEHRAPCAIAADVRKLWDRRITGQGAGAGLYPDSAAEETLLRDMGAEPCGYADGLPGYYVL